MRWVVLGDSYAFGWGVEDDQAGEAADDAAAEDAEDAGDAGLARVEGPAPVPPLQRERVALAQAGDHEEAIKAYDESLARRPGWTTSSAASRVRVAPSTPAGRLRDRDTRSPGQGRHSGCHSPCLPWW